MPSARTAAEIRAIQRRRKSPLRRRRSRYEEASPFMTASLAVLKRRLLPPQYPFASFIILRRRSRLRVPFFDLGMDQNLLLGVLVLAGIGHELLHPLLLHVAEDGGQAQAPFPLGVLLGEYVAQSLLLVSHLSRSGDVIALGSGLLRLHLGHCLSFLGLASLWIQEYRHRPPLHLGGFLHEEGVSEHLENLVQDVLAELRVGKLAPAKPDRDLDLVAFVQEFLDMPRLEVQVVLVDFRLHPDLLDADQLLVLLRLTGFLLQLELVLPVVQNLAHRRLGLRSDLHEVHAGLPRKLQRLECRHDSLLIPVRVDQSHLADPNALIDPEILLGQYTSFPQSGDFAHYIIQSGKGQMPETTARADG